MNDPARLFSPGDLRLVASRPLTRKEVRRMGATVVDSSKPERKCLLPGCETLTRHNGGYCSADHCRDHARILAILRRAHGSTRVPASVSVDGQELEAIVEAQFEAKVARHEAGFSGALSAEKGGGK